MCNMRFNYGSLHPLLLLLIDRRRGIRDSLSCESPSSDRGGSWAPPLADSPSFAFLGGLLDLPIILLRVKTMVTRSTSTSYFDVDGSRVNYRTDFAVFFRNLDSGENGLILAFFLRAMILSIRWKWKRKFNFRVHVGPIENRSRTRRWNFHPKLWRSFRIFHTLRKCTQMDRL